MHRNIGRITHRPSRISQPFIVLKVVSNCISLSLNKSDGIAVLVQIGERVESEAQIRKQSVVIFEKNEICEFLNFKGDYENCTLRYAATR
jgi:hypothetical protein